MFSIGMSAKWHFTHSTETHKHLEHDTSLITGMEQSTASLTPGQIQRLQYKRKFANHFYFSWSAERHGYKNAEVFYFKYIVMY